MAGKSGNKERLQVDGSGGIRGESKKFKNNYMHPNKFGFTSLGPENIKQFVCMSYFSRP